MVLQSSTVEMPANTGIIEMETFNQILELDDDGEAREFSKGMVEAFFEQTAVTFTEMDKALKRLDLPTLSSLGHFLKGSAAALGVCKVQASCQRIQDYGHMQDDAGRTLEPREALNLITTLLEQVKAEYEEAKRWFKNYYKMDLPTTDSSTATPRSPSPTFPEPLSPLLPPQAPAAAAALTVE